VGFKRFLRERRRNYWYVENTVLVVMSLTVHLPLECTRIHLCSQSQQTCMELFDPGRMSCISFCVSFHFEEEMEVGVLRLELGAEVSEGWLISNNGI
jgi:hypothetical protein